MSIKIVAFGESDQVEKFGDKSRGSPNHQVDDQVIVENITLSDSNFLLFSVKERTLVSVQASGANGISSIQYRSSIFFRRINSSF